MHEGEPVHYGNDREKNDQLNEGTTLGQILLDSGKWRFEFKKGDIVMNTDIGIQNSDFSFYNLYSLISARLFAILTNIPNLIMILNITLSSLSPRQEHTPLKITFYSICLFISTFQSVLYFFIFHNEVRAMEKYWSKMEISKLSTTRSGVSSKPVNISKLAVGDLVYLKGDSISPADILVIETSNQRHSDKIFHVSERRITGDNKIMTKSSVRNLNPLDPNALVAQPLRKDKAPEGADKLVRKMMGQIEYDHPNPLVNFGGTFKLKNDPKVSRVGRSNVLFCGTKLYTSW